MKLAIVDCGSGNLWSVANAFRRVFAESEIAGEAEIVSDADALRRADRLVLPGVGAFATCREALGANNDLEEALSERVLQDGTPFLGICVGMQLLADIGEEEVRCKGLGWLGGTVRRLPQTGDIRIPHMGWNAFDWVAPHSLFASIKPGDHAYFVHSYRYVPTRSGDAIATVAYGTPIVAAVARGNIAGTQFHPEKSQRAGLRFLENFLRWSPG